MKYISAYLLSTMAGNENPSAKDLEKILGAASLGYDATQADLVLKALKGKNVEEVIAAGQKKLASVPSGGAAPAAVPAGNASSAAAPAAKEAPKKEEKEESDDDMGFGLFD